MLELTIEVVKPSPQMNKSGQGNSMNEPIEYIKCTGDSIFDALRNATLKFDRKLFLPNVKAYIFSEDLAREGIFNYIDFWQRDHESRRTSYILIAKDAKATDVMGIKAGIENVPANYIESLIQNQNATSRGVGIRLLDFISDYYSEGLQPTVGILQKETSFKVGVESDINEYILNDEGCAVFLEDKLVGFLNGEETKALNIIKEEVKSGIIVPNPNWPNSIEILDIKSKIDVTIKEEKINFNVLIELEGMLGEENRMKNLRKIEEISEIEKATSKKIKEDVKSLIIKLQREYRSDVIGFGQIVHRKYPKKWKKIKNDWIDIFPSATVSIKVKTKISSTGLIDLPIYKKEDIENAKK